MSLEDIPAELRESQQWVCWRPERRGDKSTKVPVNARTGEPASSTDPATWSSFDDAIVALGRYSCDGVGFVFSQTDPYAGVDLDACVDQENRLGRTAKKIVESFDTYTEVSPSGAGLHCILRGRVPAGARKQAVLDGQKVEVYSQGRFFCTTGLCITNGTPIGDRQTQLEALCRLLKAAARARDNGGVRLRSGEGRNSELTRRLGLEVARGVSGAELTRRARELNDFDPPLDEAEVERVLRSAEKWTAGEAPFLGHHRTDSGNALRLDRLLRRARALLRGRQRLVCLRRSALGARHHVAHRGPRRRGAARHLRGGCRRGDPEMREKLAKWAVAARLSVGVVQPSRSRAATATWPSRPVTSTVTVGCSTA